MPPDTVLMLFEQAAAEGVAYEDDWPYYSIHLLARIYVDDMYVFFFGGGEPNNTMFHVANTC